MTADGGDGRVQFSKAACGARFLTRVLLESVVQTLQIFCYCFLLPLMMMTGDCNPCCWWEERRSRAVKRGVAGNEQRAEKTEGREENRKEENKRQATKAVLWPSLK